MVNFIIQVFRPFRIIYLHGMAFFLWFAFTLFGGMIGIIVSIVRNWHFGFGALSFQEAMYIESRNGSFYTYSIAMVASVLSAVFIVFAERSRLQFRRHQIVTITLSIFLLFFGGIFYALSIETPPIEEMQKIQDICINWKQLAIVVVSAIVAIYSFCVCRLDSHADQFKDIMDSTSRQEYANNNAISLPPNTPSNSLNNPQQ